MRALLVALVLSSACASTQHHYVNVAEVRHQIGDAIDQDASSRRSIVSMGRVTHDEAVVFTQAEASSPRREETWVHQPDGWHFKEAKDLSAAN